MHAYEGLPPPTMPYPYHPSTPEAVRRYHDNYTERALRDAELRRRLERFSGDRPPDCSVQ